MVTGGGTGLGKAMALLFGRLGASLVLASRKVVNLESAAAEVMGETGAPVLTVPMDVRNPDGVDRTVQAALARFGQIDLC